MELFYSISALGEFYRDISYLERGCSVMKEIASGVSLLLLSQGVGGIINRLAGGGPSWFLVNYIEALQGYEIIASMVLVILGAIIGVGSLKIKGKDD